MLEQQGRTESHRNRGEVSGHRKDTEHRKTQPKGMRAACYLLLTGAFAVCLPAFAAPQCVANGGTTHPFCFRASEVLWQGGHQYGGLPAGFTDRRFASKEAAAEAVAQTVRAAKCTQCDRGLLREPYDRCDYGGYCRQYTNLSPTGTAAQDTGPYSVVIWGMPLVFGTPQFKVEYFGTVSSQGLCPSGHTAFLDATPTGPNAWFCRPSEAQPVQRSAYSASDANLAGRVCTANPIDASTRAKIDHETDYASDSPYPIAWSRFYNGSRQQWFFSYDRSLVLSIKPGASGSPGTASLLVNRPDGGIVRFTAPAPSGTAASYAWVPDATYGSNRAQVQLTDTKDPTTGAITGFDVRLRTDEREHYDAQGVLQYLEDRHSNRITLFRDSLGRISRVEDDFGNHLDVSYTPSTALTPAPPYTWQTGDPVDPTYEGSFGSYATTDAFQAGRQLASITDGTRTVSYTYSPVTDTAVLPSTRWVLSQVTHEDGTVTTYHHGEAGPYTLGLAGGGSTTKTSAPGPADWTGITGEDGQRFSRYFYEGRGVASGSDRGTGLWRSYLLSSTTLADDYGNSFTKSNASSVGKPSGFRIKPCPPSVCSGSGTQASSIAYDASGNPTSMTGQTYSSPAQAGVTTTYTYNARGLPLTRTEASGTPLARTTTWTWDPTWRLPLTQTEPIQMSGTAGTRTTIWTRDAAGNPTQTRIQVSTGEPDRVSQATFGSTGNLLTETDPLGHTTTYGYDPVSGRLASVTDPLGHTTTVDSYTERGSPMQWTDPNGLVTQISYDARERATQLRRGTPATHWETTSVSYLPTGLISDLTSPTGRVTHFRYDLAHRLIGVDLRDAAGALLGTIDYTRDKRSLVTAETWRDPAGGVIQSRTATYDAYSRLAAANGANPGETTGVTYDLNHQPTQVQDPLAHNTKQTYDALNRAIATTDALNRTATLAYDVSDRVIAATDFKGNPTTYAYNGFGDLVSLTSPDAGAWSFAVDADEQRTGATDPRGVTTVWTYDANHRVTQIDYNDSGVATGFPGFVPGSETQTFGYDACPFGIGRLCSVADASGTTAFAYDRWGRVVQKTVTPAGGGSARVVSYTYDTQGLLVSQTYPSGKVLTQSYDAAGRVSGLTFDGQTVLSGVTYRPVGEAITGWAWGTPAGGTVSHAFDQNGRVAVITDADTRTYAYNLDGNLTGVSDPANTAALQVYAYDATHRLTSANLGSYLAPISYLYDFNGNRTSNTDGVGTGPTHTTTWTVAAGSNRVTATTPPGSSAQTWTLDPQGDLIDDGNGLSLTYDAKNRLAQTTKASTTTTYAYDAFGQRGRKSGPLGDERYAYDEAGRLLGVYDAVGMPIEELVYLDGWRSVATVRPVSGATTIYPILTDHLATPRKILDPVSGITLWSWDAKEPFGNQAPVAPSGFVFHGRFPGQRLDPETQLVHNGFRTYHPQAGRYVQSDPLGLEAGWNSFAYVESRPISHTDPNGLILIPDESMPYADFREGIDTLRDSKVCGEAIEKLEASSTIYKVYLAKPGENRFDFKLENEKRIYWNPRTALEILRNGTGRQSPVTGLAHELGHAEEYDRGFWGRTANHTKSDLQYGIWEERRNIENIETPLAQERGEGTRNSHRAADVRVYQSCGVSSIEECF